MSAFTLFVPLLVLCCMQDVKGYANIDAGLTEIPHNEILDTETEIDLTTNELTTLGDNEFHPYAALEKVVLNFNKIVSVSATAFTGGPINTLNIASNELTTFPDLTALGHILTTLDVSDNHINNIPNSLVSSLEKLGVFKANGNPLTAWPDLSGSGSTRLASSPSVLGYTSVTTLPLNVHPSVCTYKTFNWEADVEGAPIFNCPTDGSTILLTVNIKDHKINEHSDLTGLAGMGPTVTKLDMARNNFAVFPSLPMEIRSTITTLILTGSPIREVPSGVLDGYTALNSLQMVSGLLDRIPQELATATKILMLNKVPYSKNHDMWSNFLCNRGAEKLIQIDSKTAMTSLAEFPDISSTLCASTKSLKLVFQGNTVPCDCSMEWLHDVTECGVTVVKTGTCAFGSLPCSGSDFALIYPEVTFAGSSTFCSASGNWNSGEVASLVIRGKYRWQVSNSAGDNIILRPGAYPDLLALISDPTSMIRLTTDWSGLSVPTLLAPVNAAETPNPLPANCRSTHAMSSAPVLYDSDAQSCYTVTAGMQKFVFSHTAATFDTGYVDVITRNMDCRDPFYVRVYVNRKPGANCHRIPVQCSVWSSAEDLDETYCSFKCDCVQESCLHDGFWYIEAAQPNEGHLCEVYFRE